MVKEAVREECDLQRIITRLRLYEEEKLPAQRQGKDQVLYTKEKTVQHGQKPHTLFGLPVTPTKQSGQLNGKKKPFTKGVHQRNTNGGQKECEFCHRTNHTIDRCWALQTILEKRKGVLKQKGEAANIVAEPKMLTSNVEATMPGQSALSAVEKITLPQEQL